MRFAAVCLEKEKEVHRLQLPVWLSISSLDDMNKSAKWIPINVLSCCSYQQSFPHKAYTDADTDVFPFASQFISGCVWQSKLDDWAEQEWSVFRGIWQMFPVIQRLIERVDKWIGFLVQAVEATEICFWYLGMRAAVFSWLWRVGVQMKSERFSLVYCWA